MTLAQRSEPTVRPRFCALLAASLIALSAFAVTPSIVSVLPIDAVHMIKWVLVAPVIEELFFRGVVHAGLRARTDLWGRPWMAIAVTAGCFGLAHLGSASAVHSVLVVTPALAIGWAYERSRSISLCIGLHSACNAIGFIGWGN